MSKVANTNGCYTAVDMVSELTGSVVVGGVTGSSNGCDDFAVDGWMLTGVILGY